MKKKIIQTALLLSAICAVSGFIAYENSSQPDQSFAVDIVPMSIEELEKCLSGPPQTKYFIRADYPTAGITSTLSSALELGQAKAEITCDEHYIDAVAAFLEELSKPQIKDVSYTRYVTDILNVRKEPNTDSEVLGKLVIGNEVEVTGKVIDSDFVRISYKGENAFIHSDYLSKKKPKVAEIIQYTWSGAVLNRSDGTVQGPSGKETYYNLNMSGVVRVMRARGYTGEYWVRSDGCKMLGDYIMVAANLNLRPRGTIVATSLGLGIVADTGGFAINNPTQLDIATNW